MGYQGKRRYPILKSFYFASRGILVAFRTERNIQIHSLTAIFVLLAGLYVSLNWIEWLFILMAIFGTITLELINSSIERIVDLVTEEYHPLAEQAKDIAAGAVFLYAIFSVITGIIIFLPKFISFM